MGFGSAEDEPASEALMANGSVFCYGLVVIGKTLATKMIFASYKFEYPIFFSLLSCLTTMFACVLIFASGKAELTSFPKEHIKGFALISLLTASDMGLTNWAVQLISVALQLTIKAAIPAIVVTYERFVLDKSHTTMAYISLIPLVLGAMLVGLGSGKADFNLIGTIVMIGATFCSSIKMVTTHGMIKAVKSNMGMVSFLFWLELAMLPILGPWCLFNGELFALPEWDQINQGGAWMFVLVVAVVGGLRAYVQNMVLKYNSALTLAAANILIQAITILISIWLFKTETSGMMDLGIFVSLVGYGVYSYQSGQSKAKAAADKAAAATLSAAGYGDAETGSGGAYPVFTAQTESSSLLSPKASDFPKPLPNSML